MSVYPDGQTYPCCSASGWPLGNVGETSLQGLWNSEFLRRLRLDMLAGRESAACARCSEAELCGMGTLRTWANAELAHHFGLVEQTRPDGSLDRLNLPYLDVRFSNVCNLRCRTCRPELSSGWQQEAHLLGGTADPARSAASTQARAALMEQVQALLPQAEIIYFAGGEPLVMEEHLEILETLISRKQFRVRLQYNTNFSVLDFKGVDILKCWDRFETVVVQASLDGMGRRGEYLRKGLLWDKVVANRERMLKVCPRADFIVLATVSAMNAWHLPDFHAQWLSQGYVGRGQFQLNPLFTPEEYCVQVLPPRLKQAVVRRYESHIEAIARASGDAAGFAGAVRFMLARDQSGLLPRFRELTLKLDAARGERFAEVFPECAELVAAPTVAAP